jgi:hypothetical protein
MCPLLAVASLALTLAVLFLFAPEKAGAQWTGTPASNELSPSALLNKDGTLNLKAGQNGNLDLHGWQVRLDPARGPVFAPAAPSTGSWSGLTNGVGGDVFAVAIQGTLVYAGGSFTTICGNATCNSGNVTANRIAKWDGVSWSAVGNGVNSDVEALVVNGTDVYAGGRFTQICGNVTCTSGNVSANRVAKWSGAAWSAVGFGTNDTVRSLAVNGSDLYVGGQFTKVCGDTSCSSGLATTVNRIAKWDGSNWSALDFGTSHYVYALVVSGSDLYVGGSFWDVCGNLSCTSGNLTVNYVAKWDGSNWSALGNGFDDFVSALDVSGSNVYAGGNFIEVCGNAACNSGNVTANRIAKWNGSNWSAMGNGMSGAVNALVAEGSDVYAGGAFTSLCGDAACSSGNVRVNSAAVWNGSSWSGLGNGLNNTVYALALNANGLYAGGVFTDKCGDVACSSGNVRVNRTAMVPASQLCTARPSKPRLKKPNDNATLSKTQPRLKWNAATCADTYEVTVKNAANNNTVDSATGLTELQYKTDPLTVNRTYKWFVKACNSFGCRKSAVREFTVQ